ncbi:efflux RND transporter periplasmic adaptor subunit [Aureibacter tunicatorum]|uniref:Multidrug efflux pump subunit AcrA (Membrane-fusion protein) n=1 Tax=Aureibacter tunicatorum TaxID=866807 RepID=A0AAE3XRE3_9BACT|nr:HlyD family efflux transporter periplasmic adaptor subunit [Aureibacter tunicatorum]MDR6240511.1 multidrug efflux pump subunit AcrA (membrane-fusion protein) [Aureibacter tunicatorum]BDD06626.1 MexH family multidrug efflux RND transporter periplasmic adaptor subunit [Aureibacter tunicatorum]
MKKRIISLSLGVFVLVISIGIIKNLPTKASTDSQAVSEPKGVLVEVVQPLIGTVEQSIEVTGRLRAVDRYEIVSEVDGQLLSSAKIFREGAIYKKNEILLQIDAEEFAIGISADRADFVNLITTALPDLKADYPSSYPLWKQYLSNVSVEDELPALPKAGSEQERLFLIGQGIHGSYYKIKSSEEKLRKYTLRAPFTGVITTSNVDAGTAVRSGSELGTFISSEAFDLEVTVPLAEMKNLAIGTKTVLYSSDIEGDWQGRVVRIGGDVDKSSQSVKVFIRVYDNHLKEGMFLNAKMEAKPFVEAMSLPRKLLNNNHEVFIVENNILKLKPVEVLSVQGDQAVISGLDSNAYVLKTVIKSAYDGMKVRVKQG